LDFASKRKEAELRSGIVRNNSLWDKLIFHKIQVADTLPTQISRGKCVCGVGGEGGREGGK
jgi:hypothetical protein